MFKSLPLTPRVNVAATEHTLERIYKAAQLGLKGDSLALAAGLLPVEFRRLADFDPLVELAEQKGRADSEQDAATVLHNAAQGGDVKAALAILQHTHNWVAKQQVQVDVNQQISIIAALEKAEQRVIEGTRVEALTHAGLAHAAPTTYTVKQTVDADADL